MFKSLEGRTAIVTGASRGIGRAIAGALAGCGVKVAIIYAGNEAAAKEAVAEMGDAAKAYACDVADYEATQALVAKVIEDFGGVDILINNAGVVRDGLLLSMKEADFDKVLATNLKGVYNMTHHLYKHFMKKRAGRIINLTSVVGLHGNAGQSNYAASKAGVIGFTKSIAQELAGRGVTCNAIAPGFIETDMTGALTDKTKESILTSVPAKRMGKAEEVAQLAVFLASDAAAYITGEVIRVDGGLAM